MASALDIERLIAIRTAKGWDQKQLADAAGIDRSVISRLERRLQTDCRLSVLVAMASALEVPPEFLLLRRESAQDAVLAPELEGAIVRMRGQTPQIQRHAALILNAFLDGVDR